MMGLSDGRKSFPIGLAVFIQYRSVTASHPASQPPSHVAVRITLNALAKASSLKIRMTPLPVSRYVHLFIIYIHSTGTGQTDIQRELVKQYRELCMRCMLTRDKKG